MARWDDLTGKVAVVTGGASGIGRAIAERMLREGAQVVIADIEQAALDVAAAEIGAHGVRTDVSSAGSMQALADAVVARHGKVDLYFSNAGVASGASIEAMTLADWQWLMGINFYGVINGISFFLPLLRANPDGGHFALTSSIAAFHVTPGIGAYTVSKFAVTALAETLAAELTADGGNVGVTILCPGPVKSQLGFSQRNRAQNGAQGAMVDSDLRTTEEGARLRWIDPDIVADILLRAMRQGKLHAFTHSEWEPIVAGRLEQIAEAFAAIPGEYRA